MSLRGHRAAAVSSGQEVRFLVALMGRTHMAFPAHWVRGIITPDEAGSEELVRWANASYERTDLASRLGIAATGGSVETRVVLYGNEQKSRSFTVDEVVELVDVERAQIQPLPIQFRRGERDRLLGLFIDVAYVALIANPFWVLELPIRKNVLDVFALQLSDHRAGGVDPRLQLRSAVLADAVAISAGPVK